MELFESSPKCKKCGAESVKMQFIAAGKLWNIVDQSYCSYPEKLSIECTRCNYSWFSETLETKKAVE